ncbi:TATA box-binding protein-like 2 [Panonychus citri]|uniref:TATA box-binding protein-like 2 n=1 Tax=Panonychus citri TaxID=50023 RepID=UPI00230783E1|nr:TATA box-binding protein-like 2 [Panonychus citri]
MTKSIWPDYRIDNIVSIWSIGPIDIKVDNTNRKKKFNAQVIRTDNGVLLVFASGKITATGFKSLPMTILTLMEIFPDREISFIRISNITASSYNSVRFNTEKLKQLYCKKDTSYEPELFPPIYTKLNGLTIMYFHTGSIVIVGAKSVEQIETAIAQFMDRIKSL